jgi:hypothetical protein
VKTGTNLAAAGLVLLALALLLGLLQLLAQRAGRARHFLLPPLLLLLLHPLQPLSLPLLLLLLGLALSLLPAAVRADSTPKATAQSLTLNDE